MTSPRIIRAHEVKKLAVEIQYNYLDLQQRCEQHLEKIRTQTRQMIIDAEKEVQKIKEQARSEGVKEGERLGMTDVQKKIAQEAEQKISQKLAGEMKTILPAFQQAIAQIKDEQQRCISSWEREVIGLSCLIAEKILDRELSIKPVDSLKLVQELLQQTVGQTVLTINVSPQDYKILEEYQQKGQLPFSKEQFSLIQPQTEIRPGGALVQTIHGEINATVEKQLERIVQELCPAHE